jgi:uncharacterized protein (TIGR02600 family)
VPGNRNPQTGTALVLVLASLIFVSVLTVGFLASMRTKLVLAKTGSDSTEVKLLSETAVNIAISQVRDATKLSGDQNLAWASQPGMIRLYDDKGAAAGYYKLYSAEDMVVTSGAFDPASEAVPAGWAADPAVFTDLNAPSGGVHPILDPSVLTEDNKEWISLSTPPTTGSANPAPMPVKWLYVLEDGSLHPPGSGSSGTRAVIPAATAANPIVGRIAFWADDESTKININTASATSSGTFWDTPRFLSLDDLSLARSQPAQREFQRYPGHPATVSLNLDVLPDLTPQQILALTPRYEWGGSEDATREIDMVSGAVTINPRRLYATVDELVFDPQRNPQGLTQATIRRSGFFLTANSRAPELNLFGKPRIAMWPISGESDDTYRTVTDRLIARASTIAGRPFYFDRINPQSTTGDISRQRNTELLNYLDRLTSQNVPGFGSSFQSKYPDDRRQILTQIFDYIRLANLSDGTLPDNRKFVRRINPTEISLVGQSLPAHRADWNTIGAGSFPRVVGASIQFVGVGQGLQTISGTVAKPVPDIQFGTRLPPIDNNIPPPDTTAIQALFMVDFSNFAHAVIATRPIVWIEIDGLDSFQINGSPLGFPATGTTRSTWRAGSSPVVSASRNGRFPPYLLIIRKELKPGSAGNTYPFHSHIIAVPNLPPAKMSFSGGTVTIRVYGARATNGFPRGDLIQTLSMTFPPAAALPIPSLANNPVFGSGLGARVTPPVDRWRDFDGDSPETYLNANVENGDVIRAMEYGGGDWRMLMTPPNQAVTDFVPHPDYHNSGVNLAHSLSIVTGQPLTGASKRGSLVAGASYSEAPTPRDNRFPMAPVSVNGVATWDWDNGIAQLADGAYINKPDEGSLGLGSSSITENAYFAENPQISPDDTFFSPNRQMPSPGMLGSLPTGVKQGAPWRTLLLRPHPSPSSAPTPANGPPFTRIPDHLIKDLFWMPMAEPYVISDPFATAGKININQQLVPFTYINRVAGLRAVLDGVKVSVAPLASARSYKKFYRPGTSGPAMPTAATNDGVRRLPLNLSEQNGTLRQFRQKFDAGEIFRSATEISDIFLVPEGSSWASDSSAAAAWYGSGFSMVGDNSRERPYANLYQLLTTKSNVFTVHYHAQALQKSKARNLSDPTVFDTGAGDKVAAAQRGATTFERYLDPNDPRLTATDPAAATATSLEEFYRARIVNTSVFNP